jgi:hypothetical protein
LRNRYGIVGVEQERDVEVPVADMADDPAAQPGAVERAARMFDRGRQLGNGHCNIGGHRL